MNSHFYCLLNFLCKQTAPSGNTTGRSLEWWQYLTGTQCSANRVCFLLMRFKTFLVLQHKQRRQHIDQCCRSGHRIEKKRLVRHADQYSFGAGTDWAIHAIRKANNTAANLVHVLSQLNRLWGIRSV